jgi:hypothetical protein
MRHLHLQIGRVALWVVAPIAAHGQQAPRLTLGPATASLSEEFSSLTWVREIKDGRLIVTDSRDGRVVVADPRTGKVEQISRRGQGPREYPSARPVWRINGDSSVMVDSPRRWLLFDGARIVATLAPDAPGVAAAKGIPRGVDEVGHVYSSEFLPAAEKPIGDSTALVRIARANGQADTITRLSALVPRRTSSPNKDGYFEFSLPTVAMADEAVPFADGWVAVVRSNPYRVEWRAADGQWIRGAPLPFTSMRMDEKEKRAFMARLAAPTGKTPSPPDSIPDWPATVPPYRSPVQLLAAVDGRLLVPRLATADNPEMRYDVVNRRGTLDAQLVLAANERIVGFGSGAVYVSVTDDDGIQRLRRHRWPPRR